MKSSILHLFIIGQVNVSKNKEDLLLLIQGPSMFIKIILWCNQQREYDTLLVFEIFRYQYTCI